MKTFGIVSNKIHCNFTNYGATAKGWVLDVLERNRNGHTAGIYVIIE